MLSSPVPNDIPNYITPRGWRAIIDELVQLVAVERPKVVREVSDAAAEGDRSENAAYIYGKRRLREIDRRAGFLQSRLDKVQIVDGRKQSRARVFFGALVDLCDDEGKRLRYQIVGVDEVDAKAGRLSWQSPVGRALLGKSIDDTVRIKWHAGERELTVEAIDYLLDPPPGETAAVLMQSIQASAALVKPQRTTTKKRDAKQDEKGKRGKRTSGRGGRPTD